MSAILVEITFDAQRTKRVRMQFADNAGHHQPARMRLMMTTFTAKTV